MPLKPWHVLCQGRSVYACQQTTHATARPRRSPLCAAATAQAADLRCRLPPLPLQLVTVIYYVTTTKGKSGADHAGKPGLAWAAAGQGARRDGQTSFKVPACSENLRNLNVRPRLPRAGDMLFRPMGGFEAAMAALMVGVKQVRVGWEQLRKNSTACHHG